MKILRYGRWAQFSMNASQHLRKSVLIKLGRTVYWLYEMVAIVMIGVVEKSILLTELWEYDAHWSLVFAQLCQIASCYIVCQKFDITILKCLFCVWNHLLVRLYVVLQLSVNHWTLIRWNFIHWWWWPIKYIFVHFDYTNIGTITARIHQNSLWIRKMIILNTSINRIFLCVF